MRFDFKTFIILLSVIFNLQTQVLAGDSIGLSVSCTIPAIPGVNAPPTEKVKVESTAAQEEKETQTSSPSSGAEEEVPIEELQETQIAQGAPATLTKIIYSR